MEPFLGWKFRVQNLLYDLEMLLVSLTHLVACIGWAHTKGPKGTNSYSSNHTPSISLICYMGWVLLKGIKYNIIHELHPQGGWACKKCVAKMDINTPLIRRFF